ncbi:Transglutaminase-like superfamily protein [Sphingobium sp. YR657]|uniref:lasso peptide biosynthesis B2 protein n=1 Tax=Sphingobium sp. YR657 TaxID=1884366 RepID=UPI00091AABD7|nr:lasso peptide biosynthesis B2 protein [Sphingobium sp. YR657]SHL51749.1 Transglutaminase-like superfamily protein [Sphingobium sp. YR657]
MKLRDGLFWCRCPGRIVFLDLEQDRYFSLSPRLEEQFVRWSGGQECDPEMLMRLDRCGVLTAGDSSVSRLPGQFSPPVRDFGDELAPLTAVSMGDIARAAIAQLRARRAIERSPVRDLLSKCRREAGDMSVRPADELAAQQIAAAFSITARLIRSVDQCLPRALAAWNLCLRRALDARLIFGVRSDPFAAHCWVQCGDAVIVGDLEQVRMFTPILAVPCARVTS